MTHAVATLAQKAGATRSRRARQGKYTNQRESKKAMQLYSFDHAAWRRGELAVMPHIDNYVGYTWANGPREMIATEYAKSRFSELA